MGRKKLIGQDKIDSVSKRKEYLKKYYQDNKDRYEEWCSSNPDKVKASKRKWADKNKEYGKEWYENRKHNPLVYLIVKDNYVGMTENISHRISQHKSKGKDTSEVVELATFDSVAEALVFERRLHELGYNGNNYNN
jgi:hypothetical protein